jgi:hypothetical protein
MYSYFKDVQNDIFGTIGSTTSYQMCRESTFFRGGVERVLNDAIVSSVDLIFYTVE